MSVAKDLPVLLKEQGLRFAQDDVFVVPAHGDVPRPPMGSTI